MASSYDASATEPWRHSPFEMPGPATSEAEVTNISQHGFRLLVDARELFLPFDDFPWFKSAPVEAIIRFERPAPTHLYWPALDVDGIAHARLFDQRGFQPPNSQPFGMRMSLRRRRR